MNFHRIKIMSSAIKKTINNGKFPKKGTSRGSKSESKKQNGIDRLVIMPCIDMVNV